MRFPSFSRGLLSRGLPLFLGTLLLGAPLAGAATINEIRTDNPGADTDEYFELAGTPGESLNGLTYIVIGDGAGGSGVVESVTPLDGYTIQPDGFLSVHKQGTVGTCATYDLELVINFENSDNVTHMLVSGFTGADGDDLDTNDDGVLDVTPWTSIVDCVAIVATVGSGDLLYCATQVGPDGSFAPGHIYRCGGTWLIGSFTTCQDDTPGDANNCGNVAPAVSNVYRRPLWVQPGQAVTVTADGSDQDGTVTSMALFYRLNGGSFVNVAMSLSSGSTYTGTIPAQVSGTAVDYYVEATDDGGATGTYPGGAPTTFESYTVQSEVITSIADIQANPTAFIDSLVIIQGQVYIRGDYKADGVSVNAYVQDGSGRGINIFGTDQSTNVTLLNDTSNIVKITGFVDQYFTTTELVHYDVALISSGNPVLSPAVQPSTAAAAAPTNEGTYIQATGVITAINLVASATNPAHSFLIDDGSGPVEVRVDDDLRGDLDTGFALGDEIVASGAGATFSSQGQIVVGDGAEIVNNGQAGDIFPPDLLAATLTGPTQVTVAFSESIDPTTGGNPSNYSVYESATPANTIAVTAAMVSTPDTLVVLTLGSAPTSGVPYTLEVSNVEDLAGNPVAAGSTVAIFDPSSVEDVMITEIMQNPAVLLDSDGEWFEVYNAGSNTVDMNGWTIKDAGTDLHVIDNGGPLLIAPGEYKVLARNAAAMATQGVTAFYEYGADITLGNSADEIILLNAGGHEVDQVAYDGGVDWPDPNGASMQWLASGDNSLGVNWSGTGAPAFGDGDLGTPGAANTVATPAPPVVKVTQLFQNHPNPFNPSTEFRFNLEKREHVTLNVYNLRGQLVRTVVDEVLDAGPHSGLRWDGRDDSGRRVTSGTYFYRLSTASGFQQSMKMILVK